MPYWGVATVNVTTLIITGRFFVIKVLNFVTTNIIINASYCIPCHHQHSPLNSHYQASWIFGSHCCNVIIMSILSEVTIITRTLNFSIIIVIILNKFAFLPPSRALCTLYYVNFIIAHNYFFRIISTLSDYFD